MSAVKPSADASGPLINRRCVKSGGAYMWTCAACLLFFETMKIEIDQEADGRWIAEVPDLSGVMAYGDSRGQAISRAAALALRVIADRIDHGEHIPELGGIFGTEMVA